MKKAGLLSSPQRGRFQITKRGEELLKENPEKIDVSLLGRFEEFGQFKAAHKSKGEEAVEESEVDSIGTPEEAIEYGYQKVVANLSEEMLLKVKECSPTFFERVVVDLLVSMGYGGSRKEAGEVLGKSGDGGIDGIIKEDKLGLDIIYIQAKRWESVVGRPEIQKFAGALLGQKARKGIFITTSSFTQEAISYANNLEAKVILIDGNRLSRLMIDHDLGVSTTASYQVKRIDSDYFVED
jgi:restriction system protein